MAATQIRRAVLTALGLLLVGNAKASIVLTWFPASDYNSNTAVMNATLGLTGTTFETFESTTLISGLSINMGGFGVPSTTLTSLPALYNENTCSTTLNTAWDGTDTVMNIPSNSLTSCTAAANVTKTITFDYAPGTTTFGIGLSNFQSLDSPVFPITNHELFVNGVDEGMIETLSGTNWTPGLQRNGYMVITGTGGTTINSVEFENLSAPDVLIFDHLAVGSSVPEPAAFAPVVLLLSALALRQRLKRTR